MIKVIAIDAGTTNIKAQVYDQTGPISDIFTTPASSAFDIKKGIVFTDIYFNALIECVEKTLKKFKDHDIHAIGITTVGPSLVICDKSKCNRIARSYNYPDAQKGVERILKMNLYKERGVGVGSQYTPEQIIQLMHEKDLPKCPVFTTIASYICHLLGGRLSKWTYPEASYNGLLNVHSGNYSRKIFQELKLQYDWFPQLTTGQVGYLSKRLIEKFKINDKRNILIFNFGTDGPASQAYFGNELSTFKIESTGAIRVKGVKPIFDPKPLVKGYPGVWNLFFKEPDGERYYISGATMNSGVNTIKHYFPRSSDKTLSNLDDKIIDLINKKIPNVSECGIELPFEFGERDGIKRRSGIQGKKPKNNIHLYYTIKEAVMFNMMQRVQLVRNAQIASGNKLNHRFIMTGPIINSKPWRDMALIMLNKIIGIKNPVLVKSKYKEVGLATAAKGIFRKLGVEDKLDVKGASFYLKDTIFSKVPQNVEILLKRWKKYLQLYNNLP